MKGLALARLYYETVGKPALLAEFSAYFSKIAIGLVGEGSDCFGFDDEISKDHDWGAGFCIWLNTQDFITVGKQMNDFYQQLSPLPLGVAKRIATAEGVGRVGVKSIQAFYAQFLGQRKPPFTALDWLSLREENLAAAVNGEVFYDGLGEFTALRRILLAYYPEDIRRKKIAACVFLSSQAGQYNFARCLKHHENVAAQLALQQFVTHSLHLIYLLNKKYCPYYKWAHRGIEALPILQECHTLYDQLYKPYNNEEKKIALIEEICSLLKGELYRQGLTEGKHSFLVEDYQGILNQINDTTIKKYPYRGE